MSSWQAVDEDYWAGEFRARLFGWSVERRFIVVRERVREDKEEALGRKLIDVPGYTFRICGLIELSAERPTAMLTICIT